MNFFAEHGIFLLIFLSLFPRLTLLVGIIFGTFISGGCCWWIGWFFAPHVLVAILALPYFDTNPVLVVIAWIFAFLGTFAEGNSAGTVNS